MSFKNRALNVRFTIQNEAEDVIDLTGHRAEALIQAAGGSFTMSTMQLRIWGMKLADMNKLSTNGLHALAVRNDQVTLSAGDQGGIVRQVFDGTILSAYIDYAGMPEVSLNIFAQAGFFNKAKPANPNTYKGEFDVASAIQSLAKSINFGFKNNGVTVKLRDQYVYGSTVDQIQKLADAAGIACVIENGVIYIWPNNGLRDGYKLVVSPQAGMVGYPTYTPTGITVKTEFDGSLLIGRKVTVDTSAIRAQGDWTVQSVMHELSTLMPNGPWFSTLQLTENSLYVAWN